METVNTQAPVAHQTTSTIDLFALSMAFNVSNDTARMTLLFPGHSRLANVTV